MNNKENMAESGNVGTYSYPSAAGNIKKNGYVVLKDCPCKVVDVSISKTGKHGHAKAHIVGLDIFTGKKYEDISTTSHNMQVPYVTRSEYQLIDITQEGFCCLMDDTGSIREDLRLPDGDLGQQIIESSDDGKDINVAVLSAMGIEQIVDMKIEKN